MPFNGIFFSKSKEEKNRSLSGNYARSVPLVLWTVLRVKYITFKFKFHLLDLSIFLPNWGKCCFEVLCCERMKTSGEDQSRSNVACLSRGMKLAMRWDQFYQPKSQMLSVRRQAKQMSTTYRCGFALEVLFDCILNRSDVIAVRRCYHGCVALHQVGIRN